MHRAEGFVKTPLKAVNALCRLFGPSFALISDPLNNHPLIWVTNFPCLVSSFGL